MISAETATDVKALQAKLKREQWTKIAESSDFLFPGTYGVSSNAEASLEAGWGARAFEHLVGAGWTESTKRLINAKRKSINPLELIAVAATVVLLGNCGLITEEQKIALRCNNSTACLVANAGVSYIAAMRFARPIFISAFQELSVCCWLVHIGTKRNRIAYIISRGEWYKVHSSERVTDGHQSTSTSRSRS